MVLRAFCFFLILLSAFSAFGQQPVPREPFDQAYQFWRESMLKKDFAAWKKATASYRQMEVRNRIISAKGEFPTEMFAMPLQAPQLSQLSLLDIHVAGPTAAAVFFGKADFGVSQMAEITDNFLVINFIEESGTWKFDRLRIVKLGMDRETLLKVREGDFSFLEGVEFQPIGAIPKTAAPFSKPDRIGELWITAIGFEVTATVNRDKHTSEIANDLGRELILGGLQKGPNNHISLTIRPIDTAADVQRHLEVAVYSAYDRRSSAARVFHYRPDPTQVPEEFRTTFSVNN